MTPATATTKAKAVRQHGGGLVHATLPRAALRGRQQCPSGGVKKSLCCAAAGIKALNLQAAAALEYPMTGVRQAQKLSTPLRSPIRPPAQPVVGYEHNSQRFSNLRYPIQGICNGNSARDPIFKIGRATRWEQWQKIQYQAHIRLHGVNTIQMRGIELRHINALQSLKVSRPEMNKPATNNRKGDVILLIKPLLQSPLQPLQIELMMQRQLSNEAFKPKQFAFLFNFFMPYREKTCGNNCSNAAESLYPISHISLDTKGAQDNEQCPPQSTNRKECPNNPNRRNLHTSWHYELRHALWLLAIQFLSSLPVSRIRVQRGAA